MKQSILFRLPLALALAAILSTSCKKETTTSNPPPQPHAGDSVVLRARPEGAMPFDVMLVYCGYVSPDGADDDRSAPGTSEIMAGYWTINGHWYHFRSLYTFPYISNPSAIKSAYLTLYSDPHPWNGDKVHANAGNNNAFYIKRVISDWDVYSPVNEKYPGPYTASVDQVLVPHTSQPYLDVTVDVTQMLQNMQTVTNSAYSMGLMVQLANENPGMLTSRIFCSAEHPDMSKWPKLVINY
ncbi:hypothetical protein [Chitinophaga sp. 212800010-3]|uniref:hypothetical protein n=1 Tax=unclassified Chitinophaga TaxID=2619133 RepID=UPI002DF61B8C|nr:hypothetical protein [Chitinophaga sp. 212800010-3]